MHLKAEENGMQVRSVNKIGPRTLPFLQISFAVFAVNENKKKFALDEFSFQNKKIFFVVDLENKFAPSSLYS